MHILGLSCYFHGAAAALLRDGELIAVALQGLTPGAWDPTILRFGLGDGTIKGEGRKMCPGMIPIRLFW